MDIVDHIIAYYIANGGDRDDLDNHKLEEMKKYCNQKVSGDNPCWTKLSRVQVPSLDSSLAGVRLSGRVIS